MRTFLFLLFFTVGLSVQAQIIDSLPFFKVDHLIEQLSDRMPDLSQQQMGSIESSLTSLLRSAPRNPTQKQKMQARQRIRRAISGHLDPKQIEQLKAMRRDGGKDALDRIIDKSTPNRR